MVDLKAVFDGGEGVGVNGGRGAESVYDRLRKEVLYR